MHTVLSDQSLHPHFLYSLF